jgi:hypothetical protein
MKHTEFFKFSGISPRRPEKGLSPGRYGVGYRFFNIQNGRVKIKPPSHL